MILRRFCMRFAPSPRAKIIFVRLSFTRITVCAVTTQSPIKAFASRWQRTTSWLFFSAQLVTRNAQCVTGESVQAWARRLRRAEFARLAAEGWLIALAHHRDDLAENVLLRLARGSGPAHLLGMQAWRAPLWRPLLEQPKTALADFLRRRGLTWREDGSNRELTYARNRLRHKVLPELEALFPGAAARLVACAEEARDMVDVADRALRTADPSLAANTPPLPRGVQRHLAAKHSYGLRLRACRGVDSTSTVPSHRHLAQVPRSANPNATRSMRAVWRYTHQHC